MIYQWGEVTLKQLTAVLDQLGFTKTDLGTVVFEDIGPKHVMAFVNKEADALIPLPYYADDESVRPVDLGLAETTLFYKGIAERSEFDALLRRAAQPKPARHRPKPEAGVQATQAQNGIFDQSLLKKERLDRPLAKGASARGRITGNSVVKA